MINLFRILAIFSYATYVVFYFVPYMDPHLYDEKTLDLLTWSGYGELFYLNSFIVNIFFAAYTITLFGLVYFQYWARITFVTLTLLSIIITGIQGIAVLPAIDGVLSYLTNLADGALISIMYFTSVSNKFNKNA